MDQDDCDIPGQNQWEAAQRARISGRAYLARCNLPATEQELLLDRALELLVREFRRGRPVQFPEAWIRTILRHELGKRRKQGLCTNLEGDVVAAAAAAPGLHDLLVDPWDLVERHETLFLGRLTNHERLVYHAVRQGWSLKRCAQKLSMSERDVRTRFGRICKKLDGFLAYLVPPPPLPSRGQPRLPWQPPKPTPKQTHSDRQQTCSTWHFSFASSWQPPRPTS